jgi:hypothetical protein
MVDIAHTLVSNSTQLDNVDLMGGARDFTIVAAKVDNSDQPLSLTLAEYDRPWKPGLTMRRLLAHIWDSTDTDDYVDKRVRLHRDEKVSFGTSKTGGTRVSHASHIAKRITVTLPTSKGKFGEFTVDPLPNTPTPPTADTAMVAANAIEWFATTRKVSRANLEAHVGKPVSEWTDQDLVELKAAADTIAGDQA